MSAAVRSTHTTERRAPNLSLSLSVSLSLSLTHIAHCNMYALFTDFWPLRCICLRYTASFAHFCPFTCAPKHPHPPPHVNTTRQRADTHAPTVECKFPPCYAHSLTAFNVISSRARRRESSARSTPDASCQKLRTPKTIVARPPATRHRAKNPPPLPPPPPLPTPPSSARANAAVDSAPHRKEIDCTRASCERACVRAFAQIKPFIMEIKVSAIFRWELCAAFIINAK